MRAYIIRRLIASVFILFVLSVVVFLVLRVAPADPVAIVCTTACDDAQYEALRDKFGLNDPYPVQYATWIRDLATGHLGNADINDRPVIETIRHRLPVTVELLIITTMFTVAIGIPFGIISALYRNSPADFAVRLTAVFGLSVPVFWVGTLVLFIPNELWGYAPPLGRSISFFNDPMGNLKQFVPPAAVLAFASAAGIMRLTRSSLLEVMRTDYIRTARSKGLRETAVVNRHALKNSMIPVVTVLGLQISGLMGGSVIIEIIFNLPGLGRFIYEALFTRDYYVVQSMTLYIGAAVLLVNLIVDISYAWLDPRIRYS